MKDRFHKFWKFVSEDIWDVELTSLSRMKRLWIKSLRVSHLVFKGFKEDKCPLHASALTFNTLMAIVPILALSLALARVFGGDDLAERQLKKVVGELTGRLELHESAGVVTDGKAVVHEENGVWSSAEITEKLNNAVDAGFRQVEMINFAALGGAGLVLLLWMVVVVLGKVEESFNTVWGVKRGRPIYRKITDYLFMVIILPFLITMAASFSIAELVSTFLHGSLASGFTQFIGTTIWKNLTVVALTAFTITVLIKFMPNAKVDWRPALVGGIVAALLFLGWLWFCKSFQVGVARYSKLYGSFAVVPIVLFWVFVSWEIVLFGAEVAFASQNCTTYRMEYGAKRANVQARLILGLSIVVEAGRAMMGKADYFEMSEYARVRKVPVRFLNVMVEELVQYGFMAAVSDHEGRYVMLRPPADISVRSVIEAIMGDGVKPEALGLMNVEPGIERIVKTTSEGIGGSSSKKTIADLI